MHKCQSQCNGKQTPLGQAGAGIGEPLLPRASGVDRPISLYSKPLREPSINQP